HARVHDAQAMFGELEREGQRFDELPVLRTELAENLLVGGAEAWPRPSFEARQARFEQAVLVVAEHAMAPNPAHFTQHPPSIGAPGHQIAHEEDSVRVAPADRLE